jgi:hypothetical protein
MDIQQLITEDNAWFRQDYKIGLGIKEVDLYKERYFYIKQGIYTKETGYHSSCLCCGGLCAKAQTF